METEKSANGNSEEQKADGHDSAPEEKKPIIDQMTDMLATAAGTFAKGRKESKEGRL